MRLLGRPDPRRIALLLLPVLLAAGALQAPPDKAPLVAVAAGEAVPFALSVSEPEGQPSAAQPHEDPPADGQQAGLVAVRGDLRADRSGPGRRGRSIAERGRDALASLPYDWRALGYAVRFLPHDGRDLGSANRSTRTITVYVRPHQSELSLRVSLAHELGHALDFEHGTQERRDAYRSIRGLSPSGPWFPCNRCNDYASPAGDFAEVFAVWLVGPGDFRSRMAGPPSAQQLRDLRPLFELPRPAEPAPAAEAPPAPEPDEEPEPERPLPALLGGKPSPSPGR